MDLFILVACLSIERYLHIGCILQRFAWAESYIELVQKWVKDTRFSKGYLALLAIMFAFGFLPSILYWWLIEYRIALSGLGLQFIILVYCLGPNDFYNDVETYYAALTSGDKVASDMEYQLMTGESGEGITDEMRHQKMIEAFFIQANRSVFGVICWYLLLGPIGALLYRVLSLLADFAAKGNSACMPFAQEAISVFNKVNWLPARLAGLAYVLAGGAEMALWRSSINESNERCLVTCGFAAMSKTEKIEENRKVLYIIYRAILIAVLVMAVFSFIVWI